MADGTLTIPTYQWGKSQWFLKFNVTVSQLYRHLDRYFVNYCVWRFHSKCVTLVEVLAQALADTLKVLQGPSIMDVWFTLGRGC